jgi:hypothetical protein
MAQNETGLQRTPETHLFAWKKDVKNEDWSHNVIENKGWVFHRTLPTINPHGNKWIIYICQDMDGKTRETQRSSLT